MEVSGQLHALAALSPQAAKRPPYYLNRAVGGPQRRPGGFGDEKKNAVVRARNRIPASTIVQLVA